MVSVKSKKKDKVKLNKFISEQYSEDGDSEHELSYYMNDRIRMMKEVLKVIKPKQIKSMAPNCIKNLDVEEINSMLLEELLGISNKRLRHIINGENIDEESSSTDPEEEKQPIDIISLDDITDSEDDFNFGGKSANTSSKGAAKKKGIKKEKNDKSSKHTPKMKNKSQDLTENEKVMSVLELLELQARARAIRSQLAIENAKKDENKVEQEVIDEDSDPDAIILETTEPDEIVIDSSDSDDDKNKVDSQKTNNKKSCETDKPQEVKKSKKIKIIRDYKITEENQDSSKNSSDTVSKTNESNKTAPGSNENSAKESTNSIKNQPTVVATNKILNCDKSSGKSEKDLKQTDRFKTKKVTHEKSDSETDEIVVINVDQEEMDGIVNV